ncbi:MAG: alpha/beta hydrolase [Oscillospiraceae bacterium]|nr:alpha/beta hydrolase [Oscillospiraceae bacterium]
MENVMQTIQRMRLEWAEGDAARDAGLTVPKDLMRYLDIRYGEYAENTLDVYCPEGTDSALPTIVSIHGGGWFYGDKELYSHYCMALSRRGFTVVNFNYRLAPEHKYPAPLEDTCAVMRWMLENAQKYYIDLDNVFMLGDSAGGQLCHQILTMLTNPKYAALFDFAPPEGFRVNACALNCGCYFLPFSRMISPRRCGVMFEAYFPEDYVPLLNQFKVGKYATRAFPPAFVMSAVNDYLCFMAKPLYHLLRRKGVETELHIYGTKAQKEIGHVFHVNCKLPLADVCNDDECAFFRAHMR